MVKLGKHELTSLAAKKLLSAFNKHIKAEKMTSKLWSMSKGELEAALQKIKARIYENVYGKWEISMGTGTAPKFFRKEIKPAEHFTAKYRKFLKDKGEKDVKDAKSHAEIKAKLKKEHDKEHKGRAFRLSLTEMKYLYKKALENKIRITNLKTTDKFSQIFFTTMKPTQQKRLYNDYLDLKAREEMEKMKPAPKAKKVRKKKTKPKPEPQNVKIKKKK